MATPQARTKTCPALPSSMSLLLSIILTVSVAKNPTIAEQPSRPTVLVVYDHQNAVPPNNTAVIVAQPPGSTSLSAFGTIQVISNILRESADPNSTVLGKLDGQIAYGRDSFFTTSAVVLKTPSYTGSITIEGAADLTNGELAITGGTGDFRLVRGYTVLRDLGGTNHADRVFELTLYIKYD